MANRTLFTSDAKFKQIVPISKNVTIENSVDATLWEAQKRFIKPILCDEYYDELIEQINTDTLTVDNRNLLENYVQDCHAWYTYYILLPFIWVKVRDAGTVNQVGDNYSTVSREDVKYLTRNALEYAQSAAIRLKKELETNTDIYVTYHTQCHCQTEEEQVKTNIMII